MRYPFGGRRSCGKTSDVFEPDYAKPSAGVESIGSTIQYAWAVDPDPQDETKGNRVVSIVKKLNCGNGNRERSREDQPDEHEMNAPAQSWELSEHDEHEWAGKLSRMRTCTSRENGYMKVGTRRPNSEPTIGVTRFVPNVDSEPTTPYGIISITPTRVNLGERQEQHQPTKRQSHHQPAKPVILTSSRDVPGNQHPTPVRKGNKYPMSVRKDRPGKALQQQHGTGRGTAKTTGISGDASASDQTGSSTVTFSDTEYTSDNSSIGSNNILCHGTGLPFPPRDPSRRASRKPRSSNELGRHDEALNALWTVVVEDLGVLAGFVLADGKACVGTMSDITRETVVESCNGSGLPS
jgi:hypothetical protein